MEGTVGGERNDHGFRSPLFHQGSSTMVSSLLQSSDSRQRAVHDLELGRDMQLGQEFELGGGLEQLKDDHQRLESVWEQATEHRGSDSDCEVGEEICAGRQEELGFKPVGGLQRHWLARQAHAHFQRGAWREREREAGAERDGLGSLVQGGLWIQHPVEVKLLDISVC